MRETATRNYRGLTVIDRSLVHSVTTNAHNDTWGASIVSAVISMGNNLRVRVVAEGMETREQLSLLQKCDYPCGKEPLLQSAVGSAELRYRGKHPAVATVLSR